MSGYSELHASPSIALSGTVLRADNPVEEMRKILAVINQTDNY